MAEFISSSRLTTWNFGTIAQRFSLVDWNQIKVHGIDFLLISPLPLLAAILLYVVVKGKELVPAILFLSLCSGPMIFFNLYRVHDYYWYANGIFAFLLIGTVLSSTLTKKSIRPFAISLLTAVTAGMHIFAFNESPYRQALNNSTFGTRVLEAAETIQNISDPTDAILIYGHDWNSSLTYYSQRKSIMTMTDSHLLSKDTANTLNQLDSLKLFVVWHRKGNSAEAVKEAISAYGFSHEPVAKSNHWEIYEKLD